MDLVETARRCIDAIRALRQTGPYQLAGHSFGGLLAYEVAQQFIAAGEEVSFLGMFDTQTPGYRSRAPWSERIRIHWKNLQASNHRERFLYIQGRVQNLLIKASGVRFVRSLLSAFGLLPQNVSARNRIASRNYLPEPYPGPLTVFKSTEQKPYERGDRTADWIKYSDRVQIITVPGDHATMLREPHVADLAREVDRILTGVDPQLAAHRERIE
jgi:thioesterase domain-containing protein